MVSYGIFFLFLFIISAGVLTIVVSPMINESIDAINPEINDGTMSSKYVTYLNLSVGLAKAIPVIILIGAAGWGVIRALEKRNEGGY